MKRYEKIIFLMIVLFITAGSLYSQSDLRGYIYNDFKEPVSGAMIAIPALERETFSGTDGYYTLTNIPFGFHEFVIIAQSYRRSTYKVEVKKEEQRKNFQLLQTRIFMESEAVVGARKKQELGRQTLTREEIKSIPGTMGDPIRALQTLPGVAALSDFFGLLVIRGGRPTDNRYYFDNMQFYIPFHFMGLVSVFNSEMIERVDLYASSFPVEFGKTLSAVLDIYSRSYKSRFFNFKGNVNLVTSDGLFEFAVPVGKKKKALFYTVLGARRSYYDLIVGKFLESFTVFPVFWDYQTKIGVNFSKANELFFLGFGADDKFEVKLPEGTISTNLEHSSPSLAYDANFHTQGVNWKYLIGDKLISRFTFSHSSYLQSFNIAYAFRADVKPNSYQAKEKITYLVNDNFKINTGLDMEFFNIEIDGFLPPFNATNTNIFDFSNFDIDSAEEYNSEIKAMILGFYTEIYPRMKKFEMPIGMRVDYNFVTKKFIYEPVFRFIFLPHEKTKLMASVGFYQQFAQPFQTIEGYGNPDLDPEKAIHFTIGIEQFLGKLFSFKTEFYEKELFDLVGIGNPTKGEQRFENNMKGRVWGFEILFKIEKIKKISGWISYTLSRAKDWYPPNRANPDGEWVLTDYDQTHIFSIFISWKIVKWLTIGARWNYSTGVPYTPVIGSQKNSSTGNYIPIYSLDENGTRYPSYHRLDLRIDFHFKLGKIGSMSIFIEVMNAYNRDNVFMATFDKGQPYQEGVNPIYIYNLPIIPLLGFEIRF